MSKVDLAGKRIVTMLASDTLEIAAELRAAREELDGIPALLLERDSLRGLLRRHHEYIAGLTGEPCLLCTYDRAATGEPSHDQDW